LRILTGPSYPVLESALIDEVRQVKSAGPLTPIALIVPSSHLVTGLRHRLVAEAGLPLLNVHFLTFYQLALRLAEERRAAAVPVTTPDVVSDFFCERLLAHVLDQGMPAMRGLAPPNLAPGAAPALWATIRDL
jgi:ATP-dependent helicase/nuclease subunit B